MTQTSLLRYLFYAGCVNFLLDVPPDMHGLIPEETVAALMRLRKNAEIE